MSVISNNQLAGAAGQGGAAGYQIDRSLRFNKSDSAYLSKNFASAGNRKTWTWSAWIKRSQISEVGGSADQSFFWGCSGNFQVYFGANKIFLDSGSGGGFWGLGTDRKFRDPSAWYHIVLVHDTTESAADDRFKIYVNGVQETSFATDIRTGLTQNSDGFINTAAEHLIGKQPGQNVYSAFQLADVHFIDGQALDPTDFGEYDDNNVWQPKEYVDNAVYSGLSQPGRTFSTGISGSLDTNNGGPASVAFNGSIENNNLNGVYPNAGNTITWTPANSDLATTVAYSSTARVYVKVDVNGDAGGLTVVGANGSQSINTGISGNQYGWVDISAATSPLTSIAWSRAGSGSQGVRLFAVEIDGEILVDDPGKNTFHLDFSDNSSNSALGDDSSGNNNDWTVNNLEVSGSSVYSKNISASGGNAVLVGAPVNAFDGSTSTSYGMQISGNGTCTVTWTPASPVPATSARINSWTRNLDGGTQTISINGGTAVSIPSTAGNTSWFDFSAQITGGQITSLVYVRTMSSSAGIDLGSIYAIEVNGTILADAPFGDSFVDSPTNGTETDTGVGGEVRGNYATLNPLNLHQPANDTLSNGNLECSMASGSAGLVPSTIGFSSGKFYYEVIFSGSVQFLAGIRRSDSRNYDNTYTYHANGNKYTNGGSATSYGATFTDGDVIGVAVDMDAGTLTFYKNGASQGQAFSGISGTYTFIQGKYSGSGGSYIVNFGQRPFAYTAPSGFKSLCTTNLTDPTIADGSTAMDVKLYTGNGSTQTISGLNHSPDLVWMKSRSTTGLQHYLLDTVRGATKRLISNQTYAEATVTQSLTAFNSDGFSLGSEQSVNRNNDAFVAWTWDGGTSTVSNTDGSVTSSVRANASAGVSIVKYSLSGSSAQTIGHGLNSSLGLLITKATGSTNGWAIWHSSFSDTQGIAFTTSAVGTQTWWDQSNMTSSVFAHKAGTTSPQGGDVIAYCFAPVSQFSAFGSYTGNGSSDGPFVFTGFRPRWLMIKSVNYADNWLILDAARESSNVMDANLRPNTSDAETVAVNDAFDFVSNGFKIRGSGAVINTNGAPFIYAAFAEHPFKYSRAR